MNTMKSVFSKIAEDKTELSKEEVKLSTVDDLERQKIKAKKALETAEALEKGLTASINKVVDAYRENSIASKQGIEIANKALAVFKDLGIPPLKAVTTWKKEMEEDAKKSFKKTKALISAISSLR